MEVGRKERRKEGGKGGKKRGREKGWKEEGEGGRKEGRKEKKKGGSGLLEESFSQSLVDISMLSPKPLPPPYT